LTEYEELSEDCRPEQQESDCSETLLFKLKSEMLQWHKCCFATGSTATANKPAQKPIYRWIFIFIL